MKRTNLVFETLQGLGLNDSVEISKGNIRTAAVMMQELTSYNAAYAFTLTEKSARIYTITRVLPTSKMDRAVFFDSIKKSEVKRAIKANGGVKTHAAAALGMSPRTFRRKLAELDLSY